MIDGGRLGGEGLAEAGVWPDDAPAADALTPAARARLVEFGGAALEATATARPFAALSRGERTILAKMRLVCGAAAGAAEGGAAEGGTLSVRRRALFPRHSARCADDGGHSPPQVLDEFTSFCDRRVAATVAAATGAAWRARVAEARRRGAAPERLLCASVHGDIKELLRPDWVFDTQTEELTRYTWPSEELGPAAALAAAASAAASAAIADQSVATEPRDRFAPPSIDLVVRRTNLSMAECSEASGVPEAERDAATKSRIKEQHRVGHSHKVGRWPLFVLVIRDMELMTGRRALLDRRRCGTTSSGTTTCRASSQQAPRCAWPGGALRRWALSPRLRSQA